MLWSGLLSIPILLHTFVEPVASEPQCAVIPYGRPDPQDCVFIWSHMIPTSDEPQGYVIYSPADPFIRLPLIYYFRSCIVHILPSHLPPLDPLHVWFATTNDFREEVEKIMDDCLLHGKQGWPPQMGGFETMSHTWDRPDGPLQVEIYGMKDYKKFYNTLDLLDGGLVSGSTFEARTFEAWFKNQKRPGSQNQASPNYSRPPSSRKKCRSCSAQHHCPGGPQYQCVANVAAFANTRLLEGCCKLDTMSVVSASGRRLLSNDSLTLGGGGSGSAASALLTDVGCACNCTYVSQACCGAPGGMVSELVELNRGALTPPDASTCCDAETGEFRERTSKTNGTIC